MTVLTESPNKDTPFNLKGQWGTRALYSVVDQGLFSGSNFLVNILLVRWLTPDGYGAFAVAFALYLGGAGVVCSLTLEPMMIYGATDFRRGISDYLRKVGLAHFGIGILLAILLQGIAACCKGLTRDTLAASALALPFMLQVWFIRRALYCTMEIAHAAAVSALYACVILGGVWALKTYDLMSAFYIYGVFIAASAGCAIYYYSTMSRRRVLPAAQAIPLKVMLAKHWKFGRWLAIASIASSAATLLYAPMLGLMGLLRDAAAYKAIQNLSMPFAQLLTAFTLLLLPVTSRMVKHRPRAYVHRFIWKLAAAFTGAACLYGIVMILCGKQIIRFLYANAFYVQYYWLVPVFASVLAINALSQSFALTIRAYESTRTILAAKVSAATVVLTTIALLGPTMRIYAIVLAMCLGALIECGVLAYFFAARTPARRPKPRRP